MTDQPTIQIPVAIIGGGPVGLTTALELARRGVRSVLFEREASANEFPRMLFVNLRSMQHCRRWGITDEIRNRTIYPADYPKDIAFTTGLAGHEITRFDYGNHANTRLPAEVPENSQICPQNIFDPLMREVAERETNTDIRFSHQVNSIEQDADGVTLQVTDLETGHDLNVRADYVVACDGAASRSRKSLGIEMTGEFHDHNISVLFRAPDILKKTKLRPARHFHIVGEHGFDGILNSVDGGTTWRLGFGGMADEPDLATFDAKARILDKIGIDVDIDVDTALPWARATRTAERYSKGRVYLAGDAAHTWSPTGGFGMNTGLNDAVDISWKLAAAINGWGGQTLLDSYDLERRPVCAAILAEARQNFVNLRIDADYTLVAQDDEAGAAARDKLAQQVQSTIRREYETIGVQMGYYYEDSPVIVSDGTEPPSTRYDTYIPSARPGHIAPHAWLEDGRSTMDLVTDGLSLLTFNGADPEGIVDAAQAVGVPLKVEDIADPKIADLYEATMVLVRPDGHICWRTQGTIDDPTSVINQVCGLN